MPFPHRLNCDGTIDSICDCCFATVATATAEAELESLEAAHLCEPSRVAYYQQIDSIAKRPPQKDPADLIASDTQTAQQRR